MKAVSINDDDDQKAVDFVKRLLVSLRSWFAKIAPAAHISHRIISNLQSPAKPRQDLLLPSHLSWAELIHTVPFSLRPIIIDIKVIRKEHQRSLLVMYV